MCIVQSSCKHHCGSLSKLFVKVNLSVCNAEQTTDTPRRCSCSLRQGQVLPTGREGVKDVL